MTTVSTTLANGTTIPNVTLVPPVLPVALAVGAVLPVVPGLGIVTSPGKVVVVISPGKVVVVVVVVVVLAPSVGGKVVLGGEVAEWIGVARVHTSKPSAPNAPAKMSNEIPTCFAC
jgi:hypothetical protein